MDWFDAEPWIWDARRADSWTFVSLPVEASEEIRELAGDAGDTATVTATVTVELIDL